MDEKKARAMAIYSAAIVVIILAAIILLILVFQGESPPVNNLS
ncbi:MAG: hypothetical protein WC408_01495 [Candidatus Micrarchaeia archaeon]